jgi:uncharacterized membrane protein YdjX (TVP38/TMEM64 family)
MSAGRLRIKARCRNRLDLGRAWSDKRAMNRVFSFLNRLDATAWRAVGVTLALFVLVGAVLVLGKSGMFTFEGLELWLESLRDGPWGLPATILVFCVSAFIGAPQFVLIAAAVVAFGPSEGFFYSWVATMVSAALTFWLGRLAGAETVRRYAGDGVNRVSKFIGRNAFMASLIVRNVPSAPFIVVNMAFGVTRASFWAFWGGAAIGILPKTALVAFAGGSAIAALAGSPWTAAIAAAAAALLWIMGMLIARRMMRARKPDAPDVDVGPQV